MYVVDRMREKKLARGFKNVPHITIFVAFLNANKQWKYVIDGLHNRDVCKPNRDVSLQSCKIMPGLVVYGTCSSCIHMLSTRCASTYRCKEIVSIYYFLGIFFILAHFAFYNISLFASFTCFFSEVAAILLP